MRYNNKKIYLVFAFALLLSFFLIINFCSAAFLKDATGIKSQADSAAGTGYDITGAGDIYGLVQTVINAFLAIVGVLLLAYLLYAGYKWMTAHGEEEKVTEAKDTIKRAITGVIIIVAAYAISIFVMGRLQQGTLNGGGGTTPATSPTTPATTQNPNCADPYSEAYNMQECP